MPADSSKSVSSRSAAGETAADEQEGVIQYQLEHQVSPLPAAASVDALNCARERLKQLGMVGQDPDRYGGLGFGNLSQRFAEGFVITGSQTGNLESLGPADYAYIYRTDLNENRVWSQGQTRPSSESTTHALIYQLGDRVGAVIHVHCPALWNQWERLGLPATPADAPYGSPALVAAVQQLWQTCGWESEGLFAMLGHRDGLIAFAPATESACTRLTSLYHNCTGGGQSSDY